MEKVHDEHGAGHHEERIVMLACSDCGGERPHRVTYRNAAVAEMRCTQCGRTIAAPRGADGALGAGADGNGPRGAGVGSRGLGLRSVAEGLRSKAARAVLGRGRAPRLARTLGAAAFGLSVRAATKPIRLWRQVRDEGPGALKSMPGRVATKPLRLAREIGRDVGRKVRDER